jgi:ParB family chromosome partitioning protein
MEQIQKVAIEKLSLRPQVRERANDETIVGLQASIKSVGLQQPLRVTLDDGEMVVLDGERRLHALRGRGEQMVPVIIEERNLTAAEVLIRQLVANTQRKGLSPLEIARAMKELMAESGMNAKEAAMACGFSEAAVSKVLKVLESPEEVQAKVANGQLPLSTAYEIARLTDARKQAELADDVVTGKLTRAAVKRRIKGEKQGRKRVKRQSVPSVVADLGGGRSITVRGRGLENIEALIAWLSETSAWLKEALAEGRDLASLAEYFRERVKPRVA